MPPSPPADPRPPRHKSHRDPWYRAFHDLMPYRAREILLVSSPYEAFTLEEDGRLTERIVTAYHELNLSMAPRITHVSTGARAMELLAERRFDLVLTMMRILDTDVRSFGQKVKAVYPYMPVVLLVLTEADLTQYPNGLEGAIDHVFWWTGDASILLAVIKLVEDSLNAPHDTSAAGVRVIIVVEDSIRRYSSFLGTMYAELMRQSNSLMHEGVNELHRAQRMRARPKVLLARTYEQAMALFRRYRSNLVAVVTDVRFPWGGEDHAEAGLELVWEIRALEPDMAVLIQSSEPHNATLAEEGLGVRFANKNSPSFLKEIRLFVTESLGFGDFVFRLPDRTEVARARDMWELEQALRTVPIESLVYHATRNHFSLWMMARAMFALAEEVKPRSIDEFGGPEPLRQYLLQTLEASRMEEQDGVVSDFESRHHAAGAQFLRVGTGSIGGKARGLGFVSSLLSRNDMRDSIEGLHISVPRSVVVATDEFERFVESAGLTGDARMLPDEDQIHIALAGSLSPQVLRDLRQAVSEMHGPLAVRSSSLLEDSQLQPFAGIYTTYMLPNNHPDADVRFAEICRAIKAVYASTYCGAARAYMASTPYSIEEERMAVLIQEVVGRSYGSRFYPTASGVAVSYNYYPVGHQRHEDGQVQIALGLGQTIVQGGSSVEFSPASPELLPQFGSPQDYLRYSQSKFFGLDLTRSKVDFNAGAEESLREYTLADAEADGALALVASVYSREDDVIRDDLSTPGPRVVSFHNILKYGAVAVPAALKALLEVFREGLGCAVELEFALDAGDWGKYPPKGQTFKPPLLAVLQVRPQATQVFDTEVDLEDLPQDRILCSTDRSMGHGTIDAIQDIVVVDRCDLTAQETPAVAAEVGVLNAQLLAEKRPYLLIGPGRWGSSDAQLGIPVKWAQIAGAKVIVETEFADREVEPSQGAHFFHNVLSCRIGYLSLSHLDKRATASQRFIDAPWLVAQAAVTAGPYVRHIRLEKPVKVLLDGKRGAAVVLKPEG